MDTLTTGPTTLKAPRRIPDTRLNPDGRQMRRFERQLEAALVTALGNLQAALFEGVTEDNVQDILTRLDDPETAQAFQDAISGQVLTIALAGADLGQEQVEREVFGTIKQVIDPGQIDWTLANEAAGSFARRYSFDLVSNLFGSRRRVLQEEIAGFVENSLTINQLAERVSTWFDAARAKLIAVTEVTRVFAEGNQAAWRESGVIERNRWNTANDELVCPICGPLHNMIRPLGGDFPGAGTGPPAHPRCRCWLTPVVEGAEERPVGI